MVGIADVKNAHTFAAAFREARSFFLKQFFRTIDRAKARSDII